MARQEILAAVTATVLSWAVWLTIASGAFAQNTNQVLGQVNFEGKTNIDKSSGVWVDSQYLGYVKELKGNKQVLLVPGKHEITESIEAGPGSTTAIIMIMSSNRAVVGKFALPSYLRIVGWEPQQRCLLLHWPF